MAMPRPARDAAREGWIATKAAGALAEHAATLTAGRARSLLRAEAGRLRDGAEPLLMAALRERIANRPSSVFIDWSRDAAEALGDAEAALAIHPVLAAVIEGIKIIDDIQDGERRCLAAEVGIERALNVAFAAFGEALCRTAELPFDDRSWSAAAAAVGRGIRETALGQSWSRRRPARMKATGTWWITKRRRSSPRRWSLVRSPPAPTLSTPPR